MTRRSRQNHSPIFKAKVACAALKGDKAISKLATQFDLRPDQVKPQPIPMAAQRRLQRSAANNR